MSHLLSLDKLNLAYGLDKLLDDAKFQLHRGERVCLIGQNGAGKSSLLKIIDGTHLPDSGTVWRQPGLKIARLTQELPQDVDKTVFDYVASGLEALGSLLADYHHLTHAMSITSSESDLVKLQRLQEAIDHQQGWQFEKTIETVLMRLDLNADARVSDLSGGWQRRAALARALVMQPDVLLLDEPTNHLDISAIQWLEEYLLTSGVTLLFITHDRALLKRLATRIIELDRGKLTSWPGDYEQFLIHKAEMLHEEAKHHADFDKKLAQEEVWIRQGIKARRTRNEGRVRQLEAMRMQRAKRREQTGRASFSINTALQSGDLVMEAKHIRFAYGDRDIVNDFSTRIMRGDKIGFIGPNGAGKSTLLGLLLGQLQPQQGEVVMGTKLQIAYFDQLRRGLDPNKTVIDNVAEGLEIIEVNGRKQHIISYLGDFLFTPKRALTRVSALSGGECNRLLLARLFTQPANLLVLDEPTNDLDMETLELLEELLLQFAGTLLIVSHDRAFLDNVVTSTIVFEGQGRWQEYVGGYQAAVIAPFAPTPKETQPAKPIASQPSSTAMSKQEMRELQACPKRIEVLEAEIADVEAILAGPDFYQGPAETIASTLARLSTLQKELESVYQRWNELELKANPSIS